MSSLNRVQLIGNVGRDPELRSLANGDRIATFSIATSERWRDKASGDMKERVEWTRVVVFNPHLVEVVEKYVRKGSKLYVEGSLQTRSWDKDGVKQYSTEVTLQRFRGEIVLLDGKAAGDGAKEASQDLNDEIPWN